MNTSKYRKRILEILKENPVHPSANELYLMVKEKYPEIGIATIYRNLENLVKSGEIIKFTTDSQYDRYDATIIAHYHMICMKCGKVFDIPSSDVDVSNVRVSESTGHDVLEHNLVFKGICKECKNKKNEQVKEVGDEISKM